MIDDKVDDKVGGGYSSSRSDRLIEKLAKSLMPDHFLYIKIGLQCENLR